MIEQELTPAQNLNVEWESSPVISENPFLEVGDKNTKLFLFLFSVILRVNFKSSPPRTTIMRPPPKEPPLILSSLFNGVDQNEVQKLWNESRRELWRENFHERQYR